MSSPPTHAVRRRRVFYIPGYDPIPPRKYREIYRREGAEQAAVSGYELSIAPRSAGEGVETLRDGKARGLWSRTFGV